MIWTAFASRIDRYGRRALFVCVALAVSGSTACARAKADDDLRVSTRASRDQDGLHCVWRVTNRGNRFITELRVRTLTPRRATPAGAGTAHSVSPNGWFASSGLSARYWIGGEPDIVLAPGESAEYGWSFMVQPDKPFRCTDVEISARGSLARPPHVEPARLALSIAAVKPKVVPAAHGGSSVNVDASIVFHNDGPTDALLDLGYLLGNGESYPTQVSLILRDGAGHERPLTLPQRSGVAGRVDPMDVGLTAGASYSLERQRETRALPAGRYEAIARYTGANVVSMNDGTPPGRRWLGKVESPPFEVVVP